MKKKILCFALSAAFMLLGVHVFPQVKNTGGSLDKKIDAIIKKLTLEEKIAMLHANGIFSTAGVPRLGIPGLMTDDGPLGVREDVKEGWGSANLTTDSATFFPNG
ncbi:MAG: glycosyl hydrolase, partial [Bacteroidetes bacterium]|nr:glycosyl hydrolase [Bacteroidota bacterium]